MKNNWTQILVFGIIFLILGFLLGRITGKKPHMEKHRIMMSDGENMWVDKHGDHMIMMEGDGGEEMIIVRELENSNFQGDTTIAIEGGEIKITKDGDEMNVEVELTEEREGDGDVDKEVEKEVKIIKKKMN